MLLPVILPGVDGLEERSTIAFEAVDDPQLLVAVTLILLATALEAKETVIDDVPCPDVMVAPAGNVQLYVTPASEGDAVYILFVEGRQKPVEPFIFKEETGLPPETDNIPDVSEH